MTQKIQNEVSDSNSIIHQMYLLQNEYRTESFGKQSVLKSQP